MDRRGIALAAVLALASSVRAGETFGFLCDFGACGCGAGWLGPWDGATDGYDADLEAVLWYFGGAGYAGVYHYSDGDDWSGPSGYYLRDMRGPKLGNERITWAPMHLWAGPLHETAAMSLGLQADNLRRPPKSREYTLKLTHVPAGVVGAPAVGSLWYVPYTGPFEIAVPSYWTGGDGRLGYRFEFSMSAETLRGDADCSGAVDFADIDAFIESLAGRANWETYLGGEPACGYRLSCDMNADGSVDFQDIDAFVECLGGNCGG